MTETKAPVAVQDINALIDQLDVLEQEKAEIAELLKNKNKEIMVLEAQAGEWLDELGQKEFTLPGVGKIQQKEEYNLPVPKGEDKLEFFEYLKGRELFDEYATIHAAQFKAFFFREQEAYIEQGGDPLTFRLPGIATPERCVKAKFVRAKK